MPVGPVMAAGPVRPVEVVLAWERMAEGEEEEGAACNCSQPEWRVQECTVVASQTLWPKLEIQRLRVNWVRECQVIRKL